jgi:large subunit ribosomal protein L24
MGQVASRLPRKQRKYRHTAPIHARRRWVSAPLSRELRRRYGRRQLTVRQGDTVLVTGGSFEGREERVAKVDVRSGTVTLDNVTLKKADQKLKELPLKPALLLLTRLNLADPWRRTKLKVTEVPAEEAEEPKRETPADAPAPTPPAKEASA